MNRFLHFFSTKPTPSSDSLFAFLQQCQAQGGHLAFSPMALSDDNRKSELNALMNPLDLSRHEKRKIIRDYLTPLSRFTITPNEFGIATSHPEQQVFPCQVCDNCAPGLFEHYGYYIADTGWCSQCHQRGECIDVPLIEYYRQHGIDDDTINRYLPRKRWGLRGSGAPPLYQSLEDIKAIHHSLFDMARARLTLHSLNQ